MLNPITVHLPKQPAYSYPIHIGAKFLENIHSYLPKVGSTAVIITDDTVKALYALSLHQSLSKAGHKTLLLSFPAGEVFKNGQTKSWLEGEMFAEACDRDSVILAMGGGVVGDVAGFVAATYMRGIDYIQVPTTLLAMLDSSVGGKTSINTPQGKNLIGAFWQPKAVIADIACLNTLPQEHLINGLVEAFKMYLTSDVKSLEFLDQNLERILARDEVLLSDVVHRAVSIKASVVEKDEKDNSLRAILNLGHTIGHALEKLSEYKLLHGYAVALGLLLEAKIAERRGYLQAQQYLFIKTLLQRLNISTSDLKKFDLEAIIQKTKLDKKKRDEKVHYVLLNGLGSVYETENRFAHVVDDETVRRAFDEVVKK
ncbi:MAG: aroB [Gammaproteobacteria bacterium]|nr:aroB [Gammaproteobacteria bacterium]